MLVETVEGGTGGGAQQTEVIVNKAIRKQNDPFIRYAPPAKFCRMQRLGRSVGNENL
jgi:hypothetical protein